MEQTAPTRSGYKVLRCLYGREKLYMVRL